MAKTGKSASRGRQTQRKSNNLTLFLVLGGVVVLLIGTFFAFQKKPTSYKSEVIGAPSLQADKEKVDLGNVKLGNPVQVSFELKNTGDQPLVFTKAPYIEVKEGC